MSEIQIPENPELTPTIPTTPESTLPKRRKFSIAWTRKNRIIAAIVGVVLVGASGGLTWAYLASQSSDLSSGGQQVAVVTPTPSPTPIPKDHADPLNGVLYTAADAAQFANLSPVAVMVENHVLARPQSGLNDAEVLYEAMAEGGITRFMAVYLANQPAKIGPVRSARLHFASWAAEYNGVYAHWGGSTEALAYLTSHANPTNLDEFTYSKAFYRDTSSGKALEHTGYTAMSSLRATVVSLGREMAANFPQWTFKDDAPANTLPQSQTVTLAFQGTPGYDGKFEYRPATNDYARWTGGQPHLDADGTQLTAKTIVLMFQKVQDYTDVNGHAAVNVTTIGSGKAVVVEDGTSTDGTWSKADMNARTTFTDANGQPMPLNRGKIWVISVPIGSAVSY